MPCVTGPATLCGMSGLYTHTTIGALPSAQILAQVADALAWPLLLLGADGSLLLANLAARQLLRQGAPLRLSAQRLLVPIDTKHRAAFQRALQAAVAGAGPQLLHWPAGKGRISASLSRLAGETPETPDGPTLLLALGARPGSASGGDLRAYAEQHHLSAAETRVLQRLALGESSTHAALALGVGAATVRSQTLSLRRKTGHASVVALQRALAELPPLAQSAAWTDGHEHGHGEGE